MTVTGLLFPDASPDQEVKLYPEFGVAVRITESPLLYDVLSGFLDTVPFCATIFKVKPPVTIALKLATKFVFAFKTKE